MVNTMNALVIGYGSIGLRHAEVLAKLNTNVSILSRREPQDSRFRFFNTLTEALNQPLDLIVVANETSLHHSTLKEILGTGYQKKILVEKPLFHEVLSLENLSAAQIYVGYNLRFHPLLAGFEDEFKKSKLLSAWMYCGQYLPNWRKNRDYQSSYSSFANQGGGVLRDLSHEIDLVHLWQPDLKLEYSRGGHWSDLKTDADDHFVLNFSGQDLKSNLGLHLNCVDRLMQRNWIFNFEHESFAIDLNRDLIRSSKEERNIPSERNESYLKLHEALLFKNGEGVCTYEEGLNVCRTIAAAEGMKGNP